MMKPVTVSFAITREDFIKEAEARMKMQLTASVRACIRICGTIMLCFACLIFVRKKIFYADLNWTAAAIMAIAVFLIFLFMPTLGLAVRKNASERFNAGSIKATAKTVSFAEDVVKINAERYKAKIPYSMFYAAYADEATILLYTAVNECCSIPKRTMSISEQEQVEGLLASKLKQKFKQEGAREWMR